MTPTRLQEFEDSRSFLIGLAYRILGSRAEAEDAVQDTFLKWREADHASIDVPRAWLTTICTRHCIDMLRAAHKTRVEYIGTWLPEPMHTTTEDSPENMLELASSLSTAFLMVLERLNPKERAAFLLREIFEMSYADVAATLDIQETACRKLVSRANTKVGEAKNLYVVPRAQQEKMLTAFHQAITVGEPQALQALLAEDIALSADGGGRVVAIQHDLLGQAKVLKFILKGLREFWRPCTWQFTDINGSQGIILHIDGAVHAAVTFSYNADGKLSNIYIVRNPDKLGHLNLA